MSNRFSLKRIFLPVALSAAAIAFPVRAETPEAPQTVSFTKIFSFIRANKKVPKDVSEILRDYADGKIKPVTPGAKNMRPALSELPDEYKTKIAEAYKLESQQDDTPEEPVDSVALDAFTNIKNTLYDYYVTEPDMQKMFNDAIEGIAVARLGNIYEGKPDAQPSDMELMEAGAIAVAARDPHSYYSQSKQYKKAQQQREGGFAGIGIEFNIKRGRINILKVTKDTPAEMAGLKAGDVVIGVRDGLAEEGGTFKPVENVTLNQASDMLTGETGTIVTLTYVRKGRTYETSMEREFIEQSPVTSRVINLGPGKKIGYLSLSEFSGLAVAKLKEAIEETDARPEGAPDYWVLDLRNNPGGLLDQGIDTADLFLEKGLILARTGRNATDNEDNFADRNYTVESYKGDILNGKKLTVLINSGSASASEIVAGALKDNNRAKIAGTTSYGKGSVQTIYPISETGGALRMTTELYFTPSGSIQQKGIEPNMRVAAEDEEKVRSEREEKNAIAYPGKRYPDAPDSAPTTESCSAAKTAFTLAEAKKIDPGLLRRDNNSDIARFSAAGKSTAKLDMKKGRYVVLDETLACAAEDLTGVHRLTKTVPVLPEKVPMPKRRP